jgi:hypothetical protein
MANNPKIHIKADGSIQDDECRKRAKKGGDTVTWISAATVNLKISFPSGTSPFGTAGTVLTVPANGSIVGTVDRNQSLGKYRYEVQTMGGVVTDDPDIILEM